jgi:hypothetical protein
MFRWAKSRPLAGMKTTIPFLSIIENISFSAIFVTLTKLRFVASADACF